MATHGDMFVIFVDNSTVTVVDIAVYVITVLTKMKGEL
jgi:hypothetical protein